LAKYPPISIFCYHSIADNNWRFSIAPEKFKKQVNWLSRNFNPIGISELEDFLKGKSSIKTPSFLLAFDDGYRDNLAIADYIGEKGIKPIVFVLSDGLYADRDEYGGSLDLLNFDEIKRLQAAGWEIGCHGATHSNLDKLDMDGIKEEIYCAKEKMEKELGFKIRYFAYPNGIYTQKAKKAVKDAGYRLAFSMDDEKIDKNSDWFSISRVGVDDTHSFSEFKIIFSRPAVLIRGFIKKIINKFK
jgi:peptidoglycan/xylan/chitin deacetylase (PgdA/CDA1 family)